MTILELRDDFIELNSVQHKKKQWCTRWDKLIAFIGILFSKEADEK